MMPFAPILNIIKQIFNIHKIMIARVYVDDEIYQKGRFQLIALSIYCIVYFNLLHVEGIYIFSISNISPSISCIFSLQCISVFFICSRETIYSSGKRFISGCISVKHIIIHFTLRTIAINLIQTTPIFYWGNWFLNCITSANNF